MAIFSSMTRSAFLMGSAAIVVLLLAPCAFAQEATDESVAAAGQLRLNAEKESVIREMVHGKIDAARREAADDLKSAKIKRAVMMDDDENSVFPFPELMTALTSNVVGSDLTKEVKKSLSETGVNTNIGRASDVNIPTEGGVNPSARIALNRNAQYKSILDNDLCIPQSLNATKACAAKDETPEESYRDFYSYFIGDSPWQSEKVITISYLANFMFSGRTEKPYINQGSVDTVNFMSTNSGIAKANVRTAITDYLAATRAPTSQAATPVMKLLLTSLVPTRQVGSVDQRLVCTDENKPNYNVIEAYACSHVSTIKGKNMISQHTINKIVEYDYLLSDTFYSKINSGSTGSAYRVQVFLKAQQLAQDYRALRLLQMKTAMTAMNIMNGR